MNFNRDPFHPFEELIRELEIQNERVAEARDEYLNLEAHRKHKESVLIKKAMGKSHAEKAVNAQATIEWLEFHVALALAENKYEYQKVNFSILEKKWQGEYLRIKLDSSVIKKS